MKTNHFFLLSLFASSPSRAVVQARRGHLPRHGRPPLSWPRPPCLRPPPFPPMVKHRSGFLRLAPPVATWLRWRCPWRAPPVTQPRLLSLGPDMLLHGAGRTSHAGARGERRRARPATALNGRCLRRRTRASPMAATAEAMVDAPCGGDSLSLLQWTSAAPPRRDERICKQHPSRLRRHEHDPPPPSSVPAAAGERDPRRRREKLRLVGAGVVAPPRPSTCVHGPIRHVASRAPTSSSASRPRERRGVACRRGQPCPANAAIPLVARGRRRSSALHVGSACR